MDTGAKEQALLAVNVGSSSIRLDLFVLGQAGIQRRASHRLDEGAPEDARAFVEANGFPQIDFVVHRVVHGGPELPAFVQVDGEVERAIAESARLAPLHNPVALEWLRALRGAYPRALIFAAFDTGFYHDLPAVAATYAIPRALSARRGIRRYGFHGLAHAWMWQRWAEQRSDRALHGRLISLQLGAGCSITATQRGRPRDTSMGFTPLEGLVMATRCGDIDPGLVAYIANAEGLSGAEVEHLLNRESGLAGVSGVSGDMPALLASNVPAARLAVDLYCYRARKYIGAYLAVLGGADAITFGGGTGEHVAGVRAEILTGLEWAGVALDPERNAAADGREARISGDGSAIEVWVIPVDEALIMAKQVSAAITRQELTG